MRCGCPKGGEEMTGLTTGPRQFNFQAPGGSTIEGGATPTGWGEVSGAIFYESKLDLRAFNMSGGLGLDLLNVTLQEGGPWSALKDEVIEIDPNFVCIDLISTVRLSRGAIAEAIVDFRDMDFPGFLSGDTAAGVTTYNSSQIVWGLWRAFAMNSNLMTAFGRGAIVPYQSGNFGQGEVIVAPHVYYYKILKSYAGTATTYIPATIVVCHGVLIELSQGQELAQMARSGQR